MLAESVAVLRDALNVHLRTGPAADSEEEGPVVLPSSDRTDGAEFRLGFVTLMVVGLDEEHSVRLAEPYRVQMADGTVHSVESPIAINARLLFVARFKDYTSGLGYLARVLGFFQRNRVIDQLARPGLGDRIDRIVVELLSLSFAEQNNLWSVLRAAYLPSLLYTMKLLVFQDEPGDIVPGLKQLDVHVQHKKEDDT